MDSTIIGAIIGAVGAIVSAFIGAKFSSTARDVGTNHRSRRPRRIVWLVVIVLLALWTILLHPSVNMYVILSTTLLLSLVLPINPFTAGSGVLALHAINYLYASPEVDLLVITIAIANLLAVDFVCFWRRRIFLSD